MKSLSASGARRAAVGERKAWKGESLSPSEISQFHPASRFIPEIAFCDYYDESTYVVFGDIFLKLLHLFFDTTRSVKEQNIRIQSKLLVVGKWNTKISFSANRFIKLDLRNQEKLKIQKATQRVQRPRELLIEICCSERCPPRRSG